MGQRETGAPVAFFFFILISIALVLDLHLFMILDGIPPSSRLPYSRNSSSSSTNSCSAISPFCTLTTKTMFLGWMDFYVHKPIATLLNRIFHLNIIMSADFVSVLHVFAAVVSFKFLAHESLSVRRFGFAIYELGNMFDSLDGVIAKANQPPPPPLLTKTTTIISMTTSTTPKSGTGSANTSMLGYLIDGICDGIGIIFLMTACLLYLQRHCRTNTKKNTFVPYKPLTTVVTMTPDCGCDASCVKCCGSSSDRGDKKKLDHLNDDDDDYNSDDDLSKSSSSPDISFPHHRSPHLPGKVLNVLKGIMYTSMKSVFRTCRTIREGCGGGLGFPAVLCGIQMIISSTFWNRSILFFVDCLEHPESLGFSPRVATESIHSPYMWLVFFSWRLFNPLAMAEYVLLSVFVDRVSGLLKFFQYSGFLLIGAVAAISEVYRADLHRTYYETT